MNIAIKAGLLANREADEYDQFEVPKDTFARGVDRWTDNSVFVARTCCVDSLPGIPDGLSGLEKEVQQTLDLDAVIYCRFTGTELGVVMRTAQIEDYRRSAALGIIRRWAAEECIAYAEVGSEYQTEGAIADCLNAQGEWPRIRSASHPIHCIHCEHCGSTLEVDYRCDSSVAKATFKFECSSDCERGGKREFTESEVLAMLDWLGLDGPSLAI